MSATKKKIYISPNSGEYAGALLVLDHVESMSHMSNAVISSHPVESQNQNIADHRYHTGKVISLTGNISDNWRTEVITNPTPVFQSVYFKESKRLRAAVIEATGYFSKTTEYVNSILDGFEDVTEKDVVDNVPEEEQFYITQARRIVVSEKDMIEEAQKKGMSVDKEESNSSKVNGIVSGIEDAKEMLKSLDRNNTIVSVQSVWDNYGNMVLKSFNNVLRNGPQRGAYWVNLVFEEEMIAEEAKKFSVISPANSEETAETEDKGKTDKVVADASDENVSAVNAIYIQVFNQQVSQMEAWIQVNPNTKDYILEQGLNTYMKASAKAGEEVAETATASNINTNMQIVANLRGKTTW